MAALAESFKEEGARQMSIESTLTLLMRRLPDADVPRLKPRLEAIEDLERLKALNNECALIKHTGMRVRFLLWSV